MRTLNEIPGGAEAFANVFVQVLEDKHKCLNEEANKKNWPTAPYGYGFTELRKIVHGLLTALKDRDNGLILMSNGNSWDSKIKNDIIYLELIWKNKANKKSYKIANLLGEAIEYEGDYQFETHFFCSEGILKAKIELIIGRHQIVELLQKCKKGTFLYEDCKAIIKYIDSEEN